MFVFFANLRSYTREFAMKMSQILPNMVDEIQFPKRMNRGVAAKEFKSLWNQSDGRGDQWQDANLKDVTKYILGSKGLQVPVGWEWIIPSHV